MLEIVIVAAVLGLLMVVLVPLFVDDEFFPHWLIRVWLSVVYIGLGFLFFIIWAIYALVIHFTGGA